MTTLESMCSTFFLVFFSFTSLFSLFSLLIFIIRLRPWCNCHVCRSFLTSSWLGSFDNLCDWYTHLLRKSPTGTIHVHVLGNIITANPENVEHIIKTNFHNYPKGKLFTTILGDLLGRGIFNVDGDAWRFQRKMASLELGSVSVRSYAHEIVSTEIQSRLIPLFASVAGSEGENGVFDLQDLFRRFSFDNICKFSFGLDPECLQLSLPISDFAVAFDLASKLSAERAMTSSPIVWKIKRFFNLGSERQLKEAVNMVDNLAKSMIEQRREMGTFLTHKDLLSRFMANIDDDHYLRDIVVSFLLAGRDTISSGLTSLFYLVAKHPEVKREIREELDHVMGPTTEGLATASFDQMRELHYLHAVLYETMRLYPPVQFDSKFCQEALSLTPPPRKRREQLFNHFLFSSLHFFVSLNSFTMASFSRWIRPEAFPLFAAVGVAVGVCGMQLVRNITTNPEVRVTKENRTAGVLENHAEGERYAEHGLRKYVRSRAPQIMPSINKYFSDPKIPK